MTPGPGLVSHHQIETPKAFIQLQGLSDNSEMVFLTFSSVRSSVISLDTFHGATMDICYELFLFERMEKDSQNTTAMLCKKILHVIKPW